MKKQSNTEIVILANSGSTGILQDLGIRQEALGYMGQFNRAAGGGITGDTDFFNSVDFYMKKSGRTGLADRVLHEKRCHDFKFLNGIILKSFVAKLGYRARLINNLEYEEDTLVQCLKESPLAVLVSTTFLPTRQSVERVVRQIRAISPEALIIAGGPQIYYSYKVFKEYQTGGHEAVLDRTFFFRHRDVEAKHPSSPDVFIIDKQGLRTLEPVLAALKSEKSLDGIPNLAFYDRSGRLSMTARIPEAYQPFDHKPDWETLEPEYFGRRMSIQGSVGCPWNCKFCNFHLFFDVFRAKSIETVRLELRQLARNRQVKHLRFTDDNLFFNPRSVKEFCNMMIEEDFPFTWSAMLRADSITPETAALLRKAKVTELLFGMESGDPTILKNMNKKIKPERYLSSIKLLNENKISTESNLFFGFPGETRDSVQRTVDMLRNIGDCRSTVNWFSPFVFIIFPFTPIDAERDRFGLSGLFTDWTHETMSSDEAFRHFADCLYEIDNLTVSDRYIATDYQILSRSEVLEYSRQRAKINHLMFRVKEADFNDKELAGQRDAEIRELDRLFSGYLDRLEKGTPAI